MRFSYENGYWWLWVPELAEWGRLSPGTRPSHLVRRPQPDPTHDWEVHR